MGFNGFSKINGLSWDDSLAALPLLDSLLSTRFDLEFRAQAHFQLLVAVASQARLKREQVTFSKFLRNKQFSLLSNGIPPPHDIFSSDR